jgi:hypothetical protein
MPYISKMEQEWITLKEAILHIQRVDGCDEGTALQQLRNALGDEAVKARYRIGRPDEELTAIDLGSELQPDFPRKKFWLTVAIDLQGDGYIITKTRDDWNKANPENKWEDFERFWASVFFDREEVYCDLWPLFISRSSISAIWGEPVQLSSTTRQTNAYLPATDAAIRRVAQKLYDDSGDDPPNVNKAYLLIRETLIMEGYIASRDSIREILKGFKFRRRAVGRRFLKQD